MNRSSIERFAYRVSFVLTAAHCGLVAGDNARVGGRLLRSGFKATIANVIIHPHFNRKTLANDVAIVRLDGLEKQGSTREEQGAGRPRKQA